MARNDSPVDGNDDKNKAEQEQKKNKTDQDKKNRKNSDKADGEKSESSTSSSDDEPISNVSLHQGINPCKCCTNDDDCNLRRFCMAIGILEIVSKAFTIPDFHVNRQHGWNDSSNKPCSI